MRKFTLTLAAVVAMLGLVSCSNSDDGEHGRSAVEFSITNEGAPFVIGMLDAGNDKIVGTPDDFVPAGHVAVTLRNRAYNQFIEAPDLSPYGQFHVTSVRVEWTSASTPADLAALQPFEYAGGMDVTIPRDADVTFGVLLSSFAMKNDPYFNGLLVGGTLPFVASARITFTGHDSGSADETEVVGNVICEFIGVVISSE